MSTQKKNTVIVESLSDWSMHRKNISGSIGLVTTMGNLHDGHMSLLKHSLADNEVTVLTIYVNPKQFNEEFDFQNYPNTQAGDIKKATELGVDFIILPKTTMMYPDDFHYKVSEDHLSAMLEGEHRLGHFEAVLTAVLKFFMLVKPNCAYFGEKDYQQLKLIEGMVAAFFLDIKIVAVKTIRSEKGLALSSRNTRLSAAGLQKAELFPKILTSPQSCDEIKKELIHLGFKVDYIREHAGRRLGAVWVEGIRLIDNSPIEE